MLRGAPQGDSLRSSRLSCALGVRERGSGGKECERDALRGVEEGGRYAGIDGCLAAGAAVGRGRVHEKGDWGEGVSDCDFR